MAIAPRGFVVKSNRCNQSPKFGLLSVVDTMSPSDPHWMASGIEWEDFICGPQITSFIDECPPATGFTKPADRSQSFCHADPFVVIGSYECSPTGRQASEAFDIARQRLLTWEGYQVERTLWTGVVQNGSGLINPSFAYGNGVCDLAPVDVSPSGAVDPVTAIALLEARLGSTVACGGTLHVPYGLVGYLAAHRLLIEEDGEYFSPTGFRIVAGHGYPGSGPNNVAAAPGETWVFATGPLVIAKSNVFMVPDNVGESVDRRINNVTVRAERFYSVGFSCALLALRVKLGMYCC